MAHDFSRNLILTKLSDKYGFSFYCLDRSVLVATKTHMTTTSGNRMTYFPYVNTSGNIE